MLVLLRSVQTLLLILVIGIGTWVRPAVGQTCEYVEPSVGQERSVSAAVADHENEEKPTGENNDGDGEGSQDGELLGINLSRLLILHEPLASPDCLNEESPPHGRETTRELFRPPRS